MAATLFDRGSYAPSREDVVRVKLLESKHVMNIKDRTRLLLAENKVCKNINA